MSARYLSSHAHYTDRHFTDLPIVCLRDISVRKYEIKVLLDMLHVMMLDIDISVLNISFAFILLNIY